MTAYLEQFYGPKPLSYKTTTGERVLLRDVRWLNFGYGTVAGRQVYHPDEVWFRKDYDRSSPWLRIAVPRTANPDAKPLEDASFALFDGPRPLKFEKQQDLHTLAKKYLHNKYHALYPPAVRAGAAEEEDEKEEKNEAKDPGAEPPVPNRPASASPKKRKAGRSKKRRPGAAKRQTGKAPAARGGRANLAAGPPEAAEGKYAADEEEPPAPLARPRVGDFVLAWDDADDEQRRGHHLVRIESIEHGGGPRLNDVVYDTHIYGAYNAAKGLHRAKWLPAYVDSKDGKLLYTASPLPRQEAWTWLVQPQDVCSQPFALHRSKVPRSVGFVCQHQHSVQ
jgi:hypothetical protein